jgi:hypothetical protein
VTLQPFSFAGIDDDRLARHGRQLEFGVVSDVFANLLEEQAQRCIQLAYQCENKNAERFLRLLAVDLMLAARMQATAQQTPAVASPVSRLADELAELGRLAAGAIKPGNASIA